MYQSLSGYGLPAKHGCGGLMAMLAGFWAAATLHVTTYEEVILKQ